MAITQLFSKAQEKLAGVSGDVYTYEIPNSLRVKIKLILQDAVNQAQSDKDSFYERIHKELGKAYGVFPLRQGGSIDSQVIYDYLLESENNHVLDIIQVFVKSLPHQAVIQANGISFSVSDGYASQHIVAKTIKELNEKFEEHAVGYQIEPLGKIVKVVSKLIHLEIIKPTLVLLSDSAYAGAQEEFLKAHEHYRQGRNKECLVDCLKSFESVMKIICTKRGWAFNPTDPAKKLFDVLFDKGLIPSFMESKFGGLRALLDSGVPTLRNKLAGHGQGATVTPVPNHVASYTLHLTATNILFLVECEKALP